MPINRLFLQKLKEKLVKANKPSCVYDATITIARAYGHVGLSKVIEYLKVKQGTHSELIYEMESVATLIRTLRASDRLFYLSYFRDAQINAKVFTQDDARTLYVLENASDLLNRWEKRPDIPSRTILDDVNELRELNHLKTLMHQSGKSEIDNLLSQLRANRTHPQTTLDLNQSRTLYVLERNYQDITGEPFLQLEFREPIVENNHETNQTAKAFLKQIPRYETYYSTPWADTIDNTKLYIPQLMFYGINSRESGTGLCAWRWDTFYRKYKNDDEGYQRDDYYDEDYHDDGYDCEETVWGKVLHLLEYERPKDAMAYLEAESPLETYTQSHFESPQHAAAALLSDLIWIMPVHEDFYGVTDREIEPAPLENYIWVKPVYETSPSTLPRYNISHRKPWLQWDEPSQNLSEENQLAKKLLWKIQDEDVRTDSKNLYLLQLAEYGVKGSNEELDQLRRADDELMEWLGGVEQELSDLRSLPPQQAMDRLPVSVDFHRAAMQSNPNLGAYYLIKGLMQQLIEQTQC